MNGHDLAGTVRRVARYGHGLRERAYAIGIIMNVHQGGLAGKDGCGIAFRHRATARTGTVRDDQRCIPRVRHDELSVAVSSLFDSAVVDLLFVETDHRSTGGLGCILCERGAVHRREGEGVKNGSHWVERRCPA